MKSVRFESGLRQVDGLNPSVIFGGGMTLLITSVTARLSPVLRKMHLSDQVKNSEDVL
jgi:hypothetical protein